MRIFLSFSAFLAATNTFAHVSEANSTQHASEHLLLAALLVPAAWLIVRKLLK